MALARTTKLQATSGITHGTGAYTTGAFTPDDNSLLLALVYASGENNDALAGSDITFSGGGLTWTSRAVTTTHPGYGYGVRAFTAPVATGASMTTQADAGTFDVHRWRVEIYGFTGHDTSSPVGATIVGSDADGDLTATMTLSGTPASTSIVIAAALVALNAGVGGITPEATWTEIFEAAEDGWQCFQSQSRTGSTSTTVEWTDLNSSGGGQSAGAAMLAIEIKEAAAGGGATTIAPTTAALSLLGRAVSMNSFTAVAIREVFVNEAGSPVTNRTGISLLIWYAGNPVGAPDLSYSALTTDADGTASWSIAIGGLVYNQPIFYVATDGGASLSQYTCARLIPTYT